jgi:hypothetical protein
MSDPKRLLDEGGDDLGVALLRAGRTIDAERAHERKIALLGAGAGLTAATVAAVGSRTTHGIAQVIFTKWAVLGLAATALVVGAAVRALTPGPEVAQAPVVQSTLEAPPPKVAAEIPEKPSAPETTSGISIHSLPDAPAQGATTSAAAATNSPAEPAQAGAAEPGLAEEVAALREARNAVAAGRSTAALAALDAYGQRFPRGRLSLEAEVLRIEALSRGGSRSAAAARAKSFLAAYPNNPYAHRVRALALVDGDKSQ